MSRNKNLSNRDAEALDRALANKESLKIAKVVQGIPDEVPSMAWRSALNEQIIAAADRKKHRRFWARIWMPAAGVGTTAAIAVSMVVLLLGPGPGNGADEGATLEASMVTAHRDDVRFNELAGPGLSQADANQAKQNSGSSTDWKESDVEGL